jgi:hypothetical protein
MPALIGRSKSRAGRADAASTFRQPDVPGGRQPQILKEITRIDALDRMMKDMLLFARARPPAPRL